MRGSIGGLVCTAALLCAGETRAAPVALLDAPRATGVAPAGSEVLVARSAARGGVRIDAVPVAGGSPREVAVIPRPRPRRVGSARLAASPDRVAAVVEFTDEGGFPTERQLWIGPTAGPLRRERRVAWGARRRWMPIEVDVDGARVLVVEAQLRDLRFRLRVLEPGAPARRVPWSGRLRPPAALAGDRVAFVAGTEVVVADWRTGAVTNRVTDGNTVDLDLAPDGRVVTETEDGALESPRFAGDRVVALEPGRFDTLRPVHADPAGGPLGLPSTDVRSFTADASGAAWIGNGCVLYAPLGSPAPAEPPEGPCPRAEVVVEEGDQLLRGRRVRFTAACVAAPASGCRGTVLVRAERADALGRGRFDVPAGTRRRFEVMLTRRGVRYVRAALRREGAAFLGVGVRVRGGRHSPSGHSGAVIDRRA